MDILNDIDDEIFEDNYDKETQKILDMEDGAEKAELLYDRFSDLDDFNVFISLWNYNRKWLDDVRIEELRSRARVFDKTILRVCAADYDDLISENAES